LPKTLWCSFEVVDVTLAANFGASRNPLAVA
jgi:hypothetical protein